MNLLRTFVPAAAVLVSITSGCGGFLGAAGRSGRVLRLPSRQAPLLKQVFRYSLAARRRTLWRRCEHSGLANAARPLWIGLPRVIPTPRSRPSRTGTRRNGRRSASTPCVAGKSIDGILSRSVAAAASAALVCAPAIAQGAAHVSHHWRRLRGSYLRSAAQTLRSENPGDVG